MKRVVVFGLVAVLLASSTGCGSNDPDALTKKMISQTNDLAAAIEKKESADTIKSLAGKLKETNEKIAALKLSPEQAKELMGKYAKEQMEAGLRMMKAAMANPEAMAALSSLGGLGNGMEISGGTTTTTTSSGGSSVTTGGSVGKKK
jgi:hypothetical protein